MAFLPDLLNWHGFYAPYCVFQQDKIITRKFSLAISDCRVSYTTHSAGGLSENDFICAAEIKEGLIKL